MTPTYPIDASRNRLAATRQQSALAAKGGWQPFVRATRFDALTTAMAWTICLIALTFCVASSRDVAHWFLIPVFLCGVLIAHDMVDWFRGRFDVFDPVGLFGIFGFIFFFLNPMLHVVWDLWIVAPDIRPDDLRPWLGWMACLNLIGLLIYRYLRDPLAGRVHPNRKVWVVEPGRFWVVLPLLLALSAFLQAMIYSGRGGIVGYMQSYTNRDVAWQTESGFVAVFAESFPILAMMAYAILARRRPELRSWAALTILMASMCLVALYFGGLKGSRSNMMNSLFWMVGVVHFTIRPLPKKVVIGGLVVLGVLGSAYTLVYKSGGLRGFQMVESGAGIDYLQAKTGRSLGGTLLGDIGRADMQAFILHQICDPHFEYNLALGRTYYATLCHFVPRFIWPDRPELKSYEGTEVLYGKGRYDPVKFYASYVYGATAEGMMNFGPVAVPFVFLIWTFFVARIRKWIYALAVNDIRRMFAPLLILVCVMSFPGDSDNIHFMLLKWGSVPFLFLWFCSSRLPLRCLRETIPNGVGQKLANATGQFVPTHSR